MRYRKPIIALSDLSDRSSAAVVLAGSLAHLLSTDLHLLHAMGLKGRPLRAVSPALVNLGRAMDTASAAMMQQAERLLTPKALTPTPTVDLDESMGALLRHATLTEPMVIISGPVWQWRGSRGAHDALSEVALERLNAPLIIVRENRRQTFNRVAIMTRDDVIAEELAESAGRWAFWLEQAYRDSLASPLGPKLDAVCLDGSLDSCDFMARLAHDRADLIVIDGTDLKHDPARPEIDGIMKQLLRVSSAPVVIVNAGRREEQPATIAARAALSQQGQAAVG